MNSSRQRRLQSYPVILPTDPAYVGPGEWHSIHTSALEAEQTGNFQQFLNNLNRIIKYFPCLKCRQHAAKFVKEYPPLQWRRNIFEWTVFFHNTVNERLRKTKITTQQARELYLPDISVCTSGCDKGDH